MGSSDLLGDLPDHRQADTQAVEGDEHHGWCGVMTHGDSRGDNSLADFDRFLASSAESIETNRVLGGDIDGGEANLIDRWCSVILS